jgi:diguanylate cyclase (GGDEF)-like protein
MNDVSNVYLVDEHAVIQCNVRDITARKAAENAVLKSNQNLVLMVSELQRRDREMSLLNHMNDLLQPCTVLAEAYHVVALVAAELFDGPEGCLAILHRGQDQLESVVRWGSQVTIESRFPLNDCWAMRRGRLHEVSNPESGLLCRHFNSPPKDAYWCVPLMVQGETLGVVCVICPPGRTPEREASDQQLAVTVGETIKLSLSNLRLREELREQATHDPLTGLYNRRYMDDSLIREIYGAQRRDSELCVAMLDLDHFKEFNDSFGHDAGDSLLKDFGRVLRETMRKSDIAFRTGGEEFLLVFPDCSAADTALRVEQVRQHVRALQIRQGFGGVQGLVGGTKQLACGPPRDARRRDSGGDGCRAEGIRLDAARRRLEETGDRIASIAEDSGFSNEEQMRGVFVRTLQIPPREYRKRLRVARGA